MLVKLLKTLHKPQLLVYTLIFIIYFLLCVFVLDPDFGWHLRFGQIILTTGSIPRLDLFSYTMPSYAFIDHEWLSDLITSILFYLGGFNLLGLIYSTLLIFSLFLQSLIIKRQWRISPLLLSATSLIPFVLIRPQLVSFTFFIVVIFLLLNKYQRYKYIFPLIFIFWANLHGGFIAGLFLYLIYLLAQIIKKQARVIDFVLFLTTVAITFINPYGFKLVEEVWHSGADLTLRTRISEWMPTFFFINYALTILLVLSMVIFIKYFKKFTLFEKLIYIFFFVFGISSYRNAIFLIPVAAIITGKGFEFFNVSLKNRPFNKKRLLFAYKILIFVCLGVLACTLISEIFSLIYSPTQKVIFFHPDNAISYLKMHPSKGEIFSVYPWGGYLIWKYPEKKVFIDGRMPSWRNYKSKPEESTDVFLEMQKIGTGEIKISTEINKYKIDTFLLPVGNDNSTKTNPETKLLYKALNMKVFNRQQIAEQLFSLGFKIVYRDNIAVIFRK